jgi:hypothetical protein
LPELLFSHRFLQLEYKALQDKLRSVEEDVRQSTDKFSELQRTFESERLVWTNDKKTLEDTIVDLSTSERTSETDRTTRESEVRQQEERALVGCPYHVVIPVLSLFRPQKIDTRVK